ncbi:unnamed protein product [Rhizoctonia solani]|uniref:F-box domain-containing protein n=2 Tax=Rhizoctonia solani TaxID=456999 RepID=A0A8H3DL00_9AGAM|nr:unnamed protein product [Rhizoctonia solani]CAE6530667.1 unnamed protein product [Rhizoctonia solani]
MGPHLSLEYVYINGIRIDRCRRTCNIRKLASIWPNVRTLSMPSQSASIRELEEFAALPSLRHLTVNLDLKHPDLPTELDFECTTLETLTSSGPVRLSTVYKDLSLSARVLLSLWPSLERVTWSDEDPARTQLAHFFNSEVLPFNRKLLFGTHRDDAESSANMSKKEMKALFKLVMEDVEEADSDSDVDTYFSEESGSE